MAPRGPRNQTTTAGRETRNSTLNAKSGSRGGISKRRGPGRVDGDGDLDMGAGAARRPGDKSNGRPGPRPSQPRGAARTAAHLVTKHLGNGDSTQLSSRISSAGPSRGGKSRSAVNIPLGFLRVHGLKSSKAATNKDGGVSDLIAFLERKATSLSTGRPKRQVTIKKVC
jgi:nuclear RNA export factor